MNKKNLKSLFQNEPDNISVLQNRNTCPFGIEFLRYVYEQDHQKDSGIAI